MECQSHDLYFLEVDIPVIIPSIIPSISNVRSHRIVETKDRAIEALVLGLPVCGIRLIPRLVGIARPVREC